MSERVGAHAHAAARSVSEGTETGSATLYIINLLSSTTPMTLEVPDAPELAGFAVFRSRRVEDGRDRYRLHLGYFESPAEAQRALAVVRSRYPAAWVALAPKDSMGSLDDTSVAQFKLIRSARTSSSPQRPVTTPPRAAPVAARRVTAPAVSRQPTPSRPARSLSAAEVLKLLESAPRAQRPSTTPAARIPAPAAAAVPQKFAIQLIWSTDLVDASRVPQLAIFDAYTLYTVQVERAGRRWHGLRLGFFRDPLSARQVALYARSDFSAAAVVPVSERECARAAEVAATAQALRATQPAAPYRSRDTDLIELKEEERPKARATLFEDLRRAEAELIELKPADAEAVATPATKPATATSPHATKVVSGDGQRLHRSAGGKRPTKTTAELLEELGANTLDLDLDIAGDRDELSASGVRHLSVSIVHRKSRFGRLIDRVGRKR